MPRERSQPTRLLLLTLYSAAPTDPTSHAFGGLGLPGRHHRWSPAMRVEYARIRDWVSDEV